MALRENEKLVQVKVKKTAWGRMKRVAKEQGQSVAALVREAVNAHCDAHDERKKKAS